MPAVQTTAFCGADQLRFHPAPLAGLEVMSAATSRSFPPHTHYWRISERQMETSVVLANPPYDAGTEVVARRR
jgi:hypothetical protein